MLTVTENRLVDGDALNPNDNDLVLQLGRLSVGSPVPDGWRVLTGNDKTSMVARVAFRFELD